LLRVFAQVITPMRRGPHGAGALCATLQPLLNPPKARHTHIAFPKPLCFC
jgi:hypothetical protein